MSNSVWDSKPQPNEEKDYSNSKYLNKRLGDGDSIVLAFSNLHHKEKDAKTPSEYMTPDGMEWIFYFTDDANKEFEIAQNNENGQFYKEMFAKRIESGEKVTIKREGVSTKTRWLITREGEAVKEVLPDGNPF